MPQRSLRICSLTRKLLKYEPSTNLQERLVAHRKGGSISDTLLIVQHPPVFTIGKRGSSKDFHTDAEELQRYGIEVHTVPRGGETTYHGPGQIVAYPIINLRQLGVGARAFVEGLEDAMVQTAGCFGIQARGRVPGKTGVWVGDRKIGAVGVRITHGISSHGIAFNVCTYLGHYKHIVPCGTPDKEVTSLEHELLRARIEDGSNIGRSLGSGLEEASSSGSSGGSSGKIRHYHEAPVSNGRSDVHHWRPAATVLYGLAEQHLVNSIARVFDFKSVECIPEEHLLPSRAALGADATLHVWKSTVSDSTVRLH